MQVVVKKSFFDVFQSYRNLGFEEKLSQVSRNDVERALAKDYLSDSDLIALLSPLAKEYLPFMLKKSYFLTRKYFGNVIFIYAPLYVSDHCVNACLYCGFSVFNKFKRRTLNYDEVRKEAEILSGRGIRHVLLLTGESKLVGVEYICNFVNILKEYFDEVSIEIYPMTEEDYARVIEGGAEGLTVYQEVYDPVIYDRLHVFGPKRDYLFRLETTDRGARSGFREINIGALLGLAPVRKEVFFTLKHAEYIYENYPHVEVAVSFPRIRPIHGKNSFSFDIYDVSDEDILQFVAVARLFLNRVGINISTRETKEFRDNIMLLGPTRMSAGSSTYVGGYSEGKTDGQFDIADSRSVDEFVEAVRSKGLCPTFVNWVKEL